MNIYRDVGCSQEQHLPNCSHFGYTGKYLSEHLPTCPGGRNAPCNCNPKARKEAAERERKESKPDEANNCAANTDRELWREREGDYCADSIHVTESGGIGMNVGGHVIVLPIRAWHQAAQLVRLQSEQEVVARTGVMGKPAPPPAPPSDDDEEGRAGDYGEEMFEGECVEEAPATPCPDCHHPAHPTSVCSQPDQRYVLLLRREKRRKVSNTLKGSEHPAPQLELQPPEKCPSCGKLSTESGWSGSADRDRDDYCKNRGFHNGAAPSPAEHGFYKSDGHGDCCRCGANFLVRDEFNAHVRRETLLKAATDIEKFMPYAAKWLRSQAGE